MPKTPRPIKGNDSYPQLLVDLQRDTFRAMRAAEQAGLPWGVQEDLLQICAEFTRLLEDYERIPRSERRRVPVVWQEHRVRNRPRGC
jgi:hypothetical protein